MLGGVPILPVYEYIAIFGPSKSGGGFTVYAPFVVLGMLSLCCAVSLVCILLQLKRCIIVQFDLMVVPIEMVLPERKVS